MQLIIIQIVFTIGLWFEALHDYAVIELQNYQHPKYSDLSRDWHRFNAWQYGLIVVAVAYACGWWPMAACLLLLRSSFFPLILNIIRGKSPFYLGSAGFDGTMQKIFGRLAGLILIAGSLAAIILINIYL
jgi:hypothetical protein